MEPTRFMLGLERILEPRTLLPHLHCCSGTKGPRREDEESELQPVAGGHLGAARSRAVGTLLELGTM